MNKLILLSILLFQLSELFACCGAGKLRLFPVGSSESRIVVVSFDLYRRCDRGEMFERFHWRGKVALNYYQGDTLKEFKVIDSTIDFYQTNSRDSNVNHLLQFYDSILPSYHLALEEAKKLKGFEEAELISYKYHKDSLPIDGIEIINDTNLVVNGNAKPIFPLNWGACGFYNNIVELRIYKVSGKTLRIIQFSCERAMNLSVNVIRFNKMNFKELNKAFTINRTRWHGGNIDYIINH